jgi:cholera toxin transcriptional activator
VVTREEIREKLWPSDTFVDFDHSLNTIVNKIREALNDSAANPRFVETLAKRGYRFLAAVERSEELSAISKDDRTVTLTTLPESSATSVFSLTRMEDLPSAPRGSIRALFLLIQAMYLVFYIIALGRLAGVQNVLDRLVATGPALTVVVILSASIGIPIRLYLFCAASFGIRDLSHKFLKLFPGLLILDELWSLSPFLLAPQIGIGLALASAAALAYVPFAQRSLVLMHEKTSAAAPIR